MKNIQLKKYLRKALKKESIKICEIEGDASKRKYYRINHNKNTLIVMDSFLEKRNFNNFIKYTKIFSENKIIIPEIFHINDSKKIIIMQDLGSNLFLKKISSKKILKIYKNAIENILKIQEIRKSNISSYTIKKYYSESFLFVDWLLKGFCNLKLSNKDLNKISKSINFLINKINNDEKKLVHRDYHSKNLFFIDNKTVIIDYQDAVYGSPLYDLVSLLNDCYTDIEKNTKKTLESFFYQGFRDANKNIMSHEKFIESFNYVTVQRHMKASGIFCRLSIKHDRHNYIQYLTRTLNYIVNATKNYDNLYILNFFAKEAINKIHESNYSSSR
tara:strand:+ start:13 stop:1002 length:990 start_codon:yes stop_codon:yes gene_type:complete